CSSGAGSKRARRGIGRAARRRNSSGRRALATGDREAARARQRSSPGGQGTDHSGRGESRTPSSGRDVSKKAVVSARDGAPALPGAFQYGSTSAGSAGGVFDHGE